MQSDLASYWDRRLDPLDWRRQRPADDASWRRAVEAWPAPDTADALELLDGLAGRCVLELACGPGHGTSHLRDRGARVVGIDVSPRRCAEAARRVDAPFCAARAERLPFADESFDLVFARDVLMYADVQAVLDECARVLVAGGAAVFVEALAGNPLLTLWRRWTGPADYRGLTRHLTAVEVDRLGAPLVCEARRYHYLLSIVAWGALFALRTPRLHAALLRRLAPLDARLLRVAPALRTWAWRGTVLLRKPSCPA